MREERKRDKHSDKSVRVKREEFEEREQSEKNRGEKSCCVEEQITTSEARHQRESGQCDNECQLL